MAQAAEQVTPIHRPSKGNQRWNIQTPTKRRAAGAATPAIHSQFDTGIVTHRNDRSSDFL